MTKRHAARRAGVVMILMLACLARSGVAEEPKDPARIARQMQQVETRLAREELGDETLRMQQAIIDELDALLDRAGTGSAEGRASDTRPASSEPQQPSRGSDSPADGQAGDRPGQGGGDPRAEPDPADDRPVRQLIEQLWAQLPSRQRAELLQLPVERFLPQYAPQIEAYFRRLSRAAEAGAAGESTP